MTSPEEKKKCGVYSNSPAQNTLGNGLRACVDWVSFTLNQFQTCTEIIQLLQMDEGLFTEQKHSNYGYTNQKRYGHIAIYYNKNSTENKGVRCEITGQGCREFEAYHEKFNTGLTWSHLFAILFNFNDIRFNRLDLAVDDFKGYFKISTLRKHIKSNEYRSLFKSARTQNKYKKNNEALKAESLGETVYFGSPKSRLMVIFYDKQLERSSKGFELEDNIDTWIRSEIRLRDERATAAALIIALNEKKIGEVVLGILNTYITFVKRDPNNKNVSRWKTANFWKKFLNGVEKLGLTEVAPDRTIERSEKWIEKQVDGTLSLLYVAHENDFTIFEKYILDGLLKLNKKHLMMLNTYLVSKGKQPYTEEDFNNHIQNLYNDLEQIDKLKLKNSLPEIDPEEN